MSACRCSCPVLKCFTRYHGYHCVYFAKLIAILAALKNIYKHLERRVKYDAHTCLSVKAEATSSDRTLGRHWMFHVAGVRETPAEPSAPQPSSTWVSGQILQSLCQETGAGGRKAPASRQPGHPFTRIQLSEGPRAPSGTRSPPQVPAR